MSNNIYDILGKLKGLQPAEIPAETANEPVYETVEAKGDIMEAVKSLEEKYMGFKKTVAAVKKGGSAEDPEAVAAAIGRKKYGKAKFQKAAAAGKKLGEDAGQPNLEQIIDILHSANNRQQAGKTEEAIDLLNQANALQQKLGREDSYEIHNTLEDAIEQLQSGASVNGEDVMYEVHNAIEDAIMSLESGLDEAAKPDYLDLDNDGDKEEAMKQAAREKEHEDRLSARLRRKGYSDEEQSHMGKLGEGEYDPAAPDADAVAKRKRLQAIKDRQEEKRAEQDDYDSDSSSRFIKGKAYGGAAQKDDAEKDDLDEGKMKDIYTTMQDHATKKGYSSHKQFTLADYDEVGKQHGISGRDLAVVAGHKTADQVSKMDEVAPPGAKAERMVKHIKKGYAKDGKLTKREKGIAYATAWKAHNKGQVEEGTQFGDTIKNSEAKMTKTKVKVAEGKEAIRNHPIYTDKAAWDHYAEELAEQEAMEMAPPVVSVQQELDEIAALAGLRTETVGGNPAQSFVKDITKTQEIDEAATRKDFRAVANLLKNIEDPVKRKELAHHHAGIFKQQNPRFKQDVFLNAAGVNEGNEFTKARLDAIAAGKDSFTVGGKAYSVSGDTSQEKTQVEESINVSVQANADDADGIHILQFLAGLSAVADEPQQPEQPEQPLEQPMPQGQAEVEEERDIEYTNTPRELTAPLAAAIPSGDDLHKSKQQDPDTANKAANPLAQKELEESLWQRYEDLVTDVKA